MYGYSTNKEVMQTIGRIKASAELTERVKDALTERFISKDFGCIVKDEGDFSLDVIEDFRRLLDKTDTLYGLVSASVFALYIDLEVMYEDMIAERFASKYLIDGKPIDAEADRFHPNGKPNCGKSIASIVRSLSGNKGLNSLRSKAYGGLTDDDNDEMLRELKALCPNREITKADGTPLEVREKKVRYEVWLLIDGESVCDVGGLKSRILGRLHHNWNVSDVEVSIRKNTWGNFNATIVFTADEMSAYSLKNYVRERFGEESGKPWKGCDPWYCGLKEE